MRKAFFMVLFIACCVPAAFAQGDDYKKGEVYVGFSHARVDTEGAFNPNDPNDTSNDGFHGVNVDAKGNLSRYFGLKADLSYHQKTTNFTLPANTIVSVDAKLYQLMGGVQLQDNASETKVRPFAFAVVGVGHASADANTNGGVTANFSNSETGLAAAFGGGLDLRLSDSVDFRLVKADYNPIRLDGQTTHNFRVGVGLNFRF
jgi:opacity protein-like surface antigen